MGLITGLLTLPIAPLRGVVWVAEQIRREAERQWSDPGVIQRELAEVQLLRDRGDIDPAEADAREEGLLHRLLQSAPEQQQSLAPWDRDDDG
jgi:hypothetical protein